MTLLADPGRRTRSGGPHRSGGCRLCRGSKCGPLNDAKVVWVGLPPVLSLSAAGEWSFDRHLNLSERSM